MALPEVGVFGLFTLILFARRIPLDHQMTRPLPEGKKSSVGRKPTFTKKKIAQLAQFAPLFQAARDTNTQSSFYHKLTLWCVTRWGYDARNLSLDDPNEVDDDGEPSLEVDELALLDMEGITEEEADKNAEYFQVLRTVSLFCTRPAENELTFCFRNSGNISVDYIYKYRYQETKNLPQES